MLRIPPETFPDCRQRGIPRISLKSWILYAALFLNIPYWLSLLVCAFPSACLGNASCPVGQKYQIVLESVPIVVVLTEVIPTDTTVWDIEHFDLAASIIGTLKAQGKIVICYFSTGTCECWRLDANNFMSADIRASLAYNGPMDIGSTLRARMLELLWRAG